MMLSQEFRDFELEAYRNRLTMVVRSVPNLRLSTLTGISRNTLTKYEKQESSPDMRRLLSIATHTRYSIHWILFGDT
ncbi:helix-turn-helix domain-containing protein [Vibrio maritimus]|uniref:helix-turn-helix domain-containing protein n=1 Tax=Vibrio maritimus TaxID=990268 RepID=UPI001F16811E|nr:helix-turn-helix transcriptional regulator [Vibrio maritimus]